MKFTKMQLFWVSTITLIVSWLFFAIFWETKLPYDYTTNYNSLRFGALHSILNLIFVLGSLIGYIVVLIGLFDGNFKCMDRFLVDENNRNRKTIDDDDDENKKSFEWLTKIKWMKIIKWFILLVILFFLFKGGRYISKDMISMYNQSIEYNHVYTQKTQEKTGYYDNMWKSYIQIEQNTILNKDVFIEVTKIVMDARKDGESTAWKWVQENQQIPYEEFTKFYSQLNSFIVKKREGYFNLEKSCQKIAQENNKMLDMFPNNIYNKILKREPINFEYGFTSDKTNQVFSTKTENNVF